MKIYILRHGDPDYEHDSLTERGRREAAALARRMEQIPIDDFYVSPLGRAKLTAEYTLRRVGRTAQTLDWLREFPGTILDAHTGAKRIPWDLSASVWTGRTLLFDKEHWMDDPIFDGGTTRETYTHIRVRLNELLEGYGYVREGEHFAVRPGAQRERSLALYCHMGLGLTLLSCLTGISLPLLWHTVFLAPSSLTLVSTQEREAGVVQFRTLCIGDTSHLYAQGIEPSRSGFFEENYGD